MSMEQPKRGPSSSLASRFPRLARAIAEGRAFGRGLPTGPRPYRPQYDLTCSYCGAEKVMDGELGGMCCPNFCTFRLPGGKIP